MPLARRAEIAGSRQRAEGDTAAGRWQQAVGKSVREFDSSRVRAFEGSGGKDEERSAVRPFGRKRQRAFEGSGTGRFDDSRTRQFEGSAVQGDETRSVRQGGGKRAPQTDTPVVLNRDSAVWRCLDGSQRTLRRHVA